LSKIFSIILLVGLVTGGAACRKASPPADAGSKPASPSSGTAATPSTPPPAAPAAPVAPPAPVPEKLPDVLARVNSEDVKKADFEAALRTIERRNQRPIPAERRDEILRGVLDELVTYTVLKQEAKARHVVVTDAEVDQRLQQLQQSTGGEESFKKALKDQNMTLARLREDTRTQIAVGKMIDEQVSAAPSATDAEAKDFYEKNPDRFKQPEMVRASHILVRVDPTADDAAKKAAKTKIDRVLKRAKAGEDFAALAKENSDDGSAQMGGDLNYFPKEKMVPEFANAAFQLKTGEISDVVTTEFGHHVIKLTDRKPASTVPLDQVNDRIKQVLTEQRKQERAEAFIAELKQKSKVEVLI
jgi:peptidyl-prolyl cis-trans isomerase C